MDDDKLTLLILGKNASKKQATVHGILSLNLK
jgi:hypothetical protein